MARQLRQHPAILAEALLKEWEMDATAKRNAEEARQAAEDAAEAAEGDSEPSEPSASMPGSFI
jgi:hypothetical protein